MPNYQLLVNADDFGRHVLIDQAVKHCVEEGCLRSATLMPGGKAFDDAVEVATAMPAGEADRVLFAPRQFVKHDTDALQVGNQSRQRACRSLN